MKCNDDRIDGIPNTFKGLTKKYSIKRDLVLREQIDYSREDINPIVTKEEMLEQSESLFKVIEEIIKEQENEK